MHQIMPVRASVRDDCLALRGTTRSTSEIAPLWLSCFALRGIAAKFTHFSDRSSNAKIPVLSSDESRQRKLRDGSRNCKARSWRLAAPPRGDGVRRVAGRGDDFERATTEIEAIPPKGIHIKFVTVFSGRITAATADSYAEPTGPLRRLNTSRAGLRSCPWGSSLGPL